METIEKTQNYDRFKILRGNRDINEGHVRRLMKSMQEELLVSFVIINKKDEIIDGQNRFEACKRLNLPVWIYRDGKTSKYGINQVQRYNTNNLTWNRRMYLNSYCSLGIKPYMQLREFMVNYPDFRLTSATAIITNSVYADKNKEQRDGKARFIITRPFEQGQLSIPDLGLSYEMAGKIMAYKKFYEGFNRVSFVSVMLKLLNNRKFDHETMIKKLELQPSALNHCHTTGQYLSMIEDIYNYKSRDKVNLRY